MRVSKYIKQKLTELKVEICSSTIIIRYFNTSSLIMDRARSKKISKEIEDLNYNVKLVDQINIYRTYTPKEYTFFSSTYQTFCSTSYILGNEKY